MTDTINASNKEKIQEALFNVMILFGLNIIFVSALYFLFDLTAWFYFLITLSTMYVVFKASIKLLSVINLKK